MADTLPPPARRRLGLILARLSSDHEGEALNAARLACKILAEHGIRPEAMAGFVGEAPRREEPRREPPRQEPPRQDRRRSGFNTGGAGPTGWDWPDEPEVEPVQDAADFAEQLLARAGGLPNRGGLSHSEFEFLSDLIDRNWTRPATVRQARWLRDIDAKLSGGARRRA